MEFEPNPIKPDPNTGLKKKPIEKLDTIDIIPMPVADFDLTDDELDKAKEILTERLEVAELLKGNYSPKQMSEWDKTSGFWSLIKVLAKFLMKFI